MEIKQADGFADQALKINPRLPAALLLKADVQLDQRRHQRGAGNSEKALAVNPRDEHVLARKAACFRPMKQERRLRRRCQARRAGRRQAGRFYFDLGQRLEDRHYFDDAMACYEKAAKPQPHDAGADRPLGLLYMRLGREERRRRCSTRVSTPTRTISASPICARC